MPKQELLGEVKKLITIGKEKGFLTYDELNSTLPAEVVSSDQFGSIMAMFGEMDIEIIEANDGDRPQKRSEGEVGEDIEDVDSDSEEENDKAIDLTPGALSRFQSRNELSHNLFRSLSVQTIQTGRNVHRDIIEMIFAHGQFRRQRPTVEISH